MELIQPSWNCLPYAKTVAEASAKVTQDATQFRNCATLSDK